MNRLKAELRTLAAALTQLGIAFKVIPVAPEVHTTQIPPASYMTIVLFEDERTARLAPLAQVRPAFDVLCGGRRLVDIVRAVDPSFCCVVREHLRDVTTADFGPPPDGAPSSDAPFVFVNARLIPSATLDQQLRKLVEDGAERRVMIGDQTALAVISNAASPVVPPANEIDQWLAGQTLPPLDANVSLLEYPHDVVAGHIEILPDNLQQRIATGDYRQDDDGVFLGTGAQIGPYVVTDTTSGPIVLEEGVTVGPHCYLRGPIHLGRSTTIVEHSSIKGPTATGSFTRLGGDVTVCVVDSFSNKAHHGFLGHSYIGSWVNLGAGTTNSNLKNTYGKINVQYDGQKIATDMQFLGCMVGDYAKTAINVSIFTGKTVGVASMLYGTVTGNVPAFVNYSGGLGASSEVSVEAAVKMQERMFGRRDRNARACDADLLRAVFDMTRDERRTWDAKLDKGPPAF